MSTKDFLRSGVGLAVPLFGALYLAACGGTASFKGGDGSGGASSAGASSGGSSNAGAPNPSGGSGPVCNVACPAIACGPGSITVQNGCCPYCVPDGTAGDGSGGYGGCGVVACPLIACSSNEVLIDELGQCCPTCVPAGNGGAGGTTQSGGAGGAPETGGRGGEGGTVCTASCPACLNGFVPVMEPGACCPMCVAPSQACTAGEQGYQTLRASLLQQSGATSCNVDSDCTNLSGLAQCGDQCVTSAVNASLEPEMANQLSLWASSYCSTCTPVYPPCAAPPTPFCSAGQCQLYHTL
jgi:hypothetical protein